MSFEETMSSRVNSPLSLPTPNLKGYVFNCKLGSGTYGEVHKVYRKTGPRDVFAIKCVPRAKLKEPEADAIVGEISMLKELKHANIVQMEDFAWDSSYIYIVMEYCGSGDLGQYVRTHRCLPETVCRQFLRQLASALQYLRSKDIAHMDLKPQNILLQGSSLKLADFGFAQKLSLDQTETSVRGSPLYMAPEIVLDRKYDAKADLWSVGVILYECLFGQAPYKSESLDELLLKIQSETPVVIPSMPKVSDLCQDLLARCLQRDPAKRIDFDEFFSHPFIDLEHFPSKASFERSVELIANAVSLDHQGVLGEALELYGAALEYLVPLLEWEKNPAKKAALKDKVDRYFARAEEIKRGVSGAAPVLREDPQSPMVFGNPELDELLRLCSSTPALKAALEIGQSAELYDREGQFEMAVDLYKKSLGLLLPLLRSEPNGPRKTRLAAQVDRWMCRAEKAADLVKNQDNVAAADSSINDECVIM